MMGKTHTFFLEGKWKSKCQILIYVLIVFPRKFQTDQSALEFLFLFMIVTENLTGNFS